jgi:NACHT domain
LGEPGSGKTTMLLELARDCIARAEQDDTQPIPVIFNLSSWSRNKDTISDWLVKEIVIKYNRSKKMARLWLDQDEILLLLDGLDEVSIKDRNDCAKAINDFRKEQGSISIVVCSRISDYKALTTRLNFQGAVLLQPLTPNQIDQYFRQVGPKLARVHQLLQHDNVLQELVKQPLMLNIMTLAYYGASTKELARRQFATAKTWRKRLFDAYIEQMFERIARTRNELYAPIKAIHWLSWLAHMMINNHISEFLPEFISNNWLQTDADKRRYRMIIGLIIGVVIGLIIGLVNGPISGLIIGLFLGWLAGRMDFYKLGISYLVWTRSTNRPSSWLVGTLSLGGFFGAPIGCLIGGLVSGLGDKLISGLLFGAIGGLAGGSLGSFLFFRLSHKILYPSLRYSFQGMAIYGLISGLVSGMGGNLAVGLSVGLIFGLFSGGGSIVSYFSLRLLFYFLGHMPWNYDRFLCYATERIFLRRVGGEYIFVHRLLMEHFAAMYPEEHI